MREGKMGEVAHYVLGDFFRFIGTVIIIALFFDGLTSVIVAVRGGKPNSILSRVFGSSADDGRKRQEEG
jgi:hypothetical protein